MSSDIVERLRRQHTIQYGWKFGELVTHTENNPDPHIVNRMNRCAICEQWSPCDVRDVADEIERLRAERDASRLVISDLEAEVERLQRWKAESITLLKQWNQIADDVIARLDADETLGLRLPDIVASELERLRAEVERLRGEILRLRAEVERLTVESEEWDADTWRNLVRMAGLLHDTANALHGGPLPGGMWSWHDLPTIATAERALADQLGNTLRLVGNDSYMLPLDTDEAVTNALDAYHEARREQ